MSLQPLRENKPFFESKETFDAIVQHWAKARINVPMEVLGRFDDAAKQLITISSLLQGLYIAAFTFGNMKQHLPGWLLALLFVPLILLTFCAAQAICAVPLKKEAFDTYDLFRGSAGLSDEQLTRAVDDWCQAIDGIANKKHWWLRGAKIFLLLNSIMMMVLLFVLVGM